MNFMEKMEIETQVTAWLTQSGYSFEEDTYVDIVAFVQRLGFTVGNARLDDHEDGFLLIRSRTKAEKIIGVNSNLSVEGKRFAIAHEFAHSALHYKSGQGETYLHRENRKGKNSDENDADYFAAALLMPKESFLKAYEMLREKGFSGNSICLELASIFKVPLESVSRRINEVGAAE